MSETIVYFVRHGAHIVQGRRLCGREPGVELSALGQAQAEAAANVLSTCSLTAVHASPVARTQTTAQIIARRCYVPVLTEEALSELDFGEWTGSWLEDIESVPAWRRWNEDRARSRPPGGESMLEVQLRIAAWLERLSIDGPPAIAAVSHADVIRAAIAYVLGLSLHFHDRIEIAPGSVSRLIIGDWGMKVHSINEAPPCRS